MVTDALSEVKELIVMKKRPPAPPNGAVILALP